MSRNRRCSDEYKNYLKSPKYREIRYRTLCRDEFKCRICGSTENLEVHHMNSKGRFHEEDYPETLITLCKYHHDLIHKYWDSCDDIKEFYAEQRHQEAMKRGYYR